MPKLNRGFIVFATSIAVVVMFLYVYSQKNQYPKIEINRKQNNQEVLYILPMGNYSLKEAKLMADSIKNYYKNIVVLPNVAMPVSCLNDEKSRYRADKLLNFLKTKNTENSFVVGLTHKDICISKNKKDWGIFGLAYCPGTTCVVSDFRLHKNNKSEELKKVTLHELGHSRGLPHCEASGCWMQDAEGKNKLDKLLQFCQNCKWKMEKQGFIF